MKRIVLAFLILPLVTNVFSQTNVNTVNAVIGDISFIERFGEVPGANTNEVLRIQTHLSYVEELLNGKDISHLNEEQKKNRESVLALLHQYWTNGIFPGNYDYEERRPCFIDRDGNICAVGYLVAETAGIKAAEEINAAHQYDFLLDMNNETVSAWAAEYGLTLEECAMIQPSYFPIGTENTKQMPIKKEYGISSGVVGGVNLAVSMINLSNRSFAKTKTVSYIGLFTGATQIFLGLTNIKKDETRYSINQPPNTLSYRSQNNLSYINLAAGTTTIVTSAVNLFLNKTIKNKRNAVNLYSYPQMNQMVAGVSFARSL